LTWDPPAAVGDGVSGPSELVVGDGADRSAQRASPTVFRTASGRYRGRMSKAAQRDPRRHRIEVRVSADQDALIRQAADLEGTTITAFVMDTTLARARRVLRQHQDLVLSNEAFDRFITELDRPTEAVAALTELFRSNPKLPGD